MTSVWLFMIGRIYRYICVIACRMSYKVELVAIF